MAQPKLKGLITKMGDRRSFNEMMVDDEVVSNLMAMNGADPVAVYKRRSSSVHSSGLAAIIVGIPFLVVPFVGIPMIAYGIGILARRRQIIKNIEKQVAEQKKNTSKIERETLKEEVRREMLKEELRAEIEAEKATKKSSSPKKSKKK